MSKKTFEQDPLAAAEDLSDQLDITQPHSFFDTLANDATNRPELDELVYGETPIPNTEEGISGQINHTRERVSIIAIHVANKYIK